MLLLLLACTSPDATSPDATSPDATSSDASGERPTPAAFVADVLAGAHPRVDAPSDSTDAGAPLTLDDLAVEPAEAMPTVLVATWQTTRPCVGSAVFTLADEPALRADEPAETRIHRLLLVGLPADAAVAAMVACTTADGTGPVALVHARTGALPDGVPSLTYTGTTDASGGYFTVPMMEGAEVATIVDRLGRTVWAWPEAPGSRGSRVRVSVDGTSVLYNVQDQHPGGPDGSGAIVRVALDGSSVTSTPITGQNHDFLELPDGTLASLASDVRTEDGVSWNGDCLVEIAPDGTQRVVWSAWDTWTVAGAPPENAQGTSWTHANSIDYDADTDSYWLGIRNLSAILHIDRATGDVLDQIGGPTPTWTFADGAVPFDGQHQFEIRGDALLLFDNQYTSQASRAVRYTLDPATHSLSQEWSVAPATAWFNQAYGDVAVSGNGGVRVTWSTAGLIQAYDHAGASQWSMTAPDGVWIGYSDRLDSLP